MGFYGVEISLRQRQIVDHFGLDQTPRQIQRILNAETTIGKFLYPHSVADNAATDSLPGALQNFHGKAQSVFDTATPVIGTLIGKWRCKLLYQMSLRAVNFDTIHTRLNTMYGAHHVGFNGLFNFASAEFVRYSTRARTRYC